MSRKRFTTMVAVVLLMGAAGLVSLYMTLGRMNTMLRAQHDPAAGTTEPSGDPKLEQMTLTPAGEAQLREEKQRLGAGKDAAAAGAKKPIDPAPKKVPAEPHAPLPPASGS